MPKNKINITKTVMSKIETGQVKMRPRWMFVAGTISLVIGVIGTYIFSSFLVSLMSFSLRTHGPKGAMRYQQLLDSFPLWAVFLAIFGLILGINLLKKFDFSYKKNFAFTVLVFVVVVLISGWLADYLGLDRVWSKQGQMGKMYQRYDGKDKLSPWKDNNRININSGSGIDCGRDNRGY